MQPGKRLESFCEILRDANAAADQNRAIAGRRHCSSSTGRLDSDEDQRRREYRVRSAVSTKGLMKLAAEMLPELSESESEPDLRPESVSESESEADLASDSEVVSGSMVETETETRCSDDSDDFSDMPIAQQKRRVVHAKRKRATRVRLRRARKRKQRLSENKKQRFHRQTREDNRRKKRKIDGSVFPKLNGLTNKAVCGKYKYQHARRLGKAPEEVNLRDYHSCVQLTAVDFLNELSIQTLNEVRKSGKQIEYGDQLVAIHKETCVKFRELHRKQLGGIKRRLKPLPLRACRAERESLALE